MGISEGCSIVTDPKGRDMDNKGNFNKKSILAVLFLSLFISGISAEDIYKTSFSFGVIGVGISSDESFSNGYYYGNLLCLEHTFNDRLALKMSPLYFNWNMFDEDIFQLTFLNAFLSYNLLDDDYVFLGPSISINTLGYNNLALINLNAGFVFSISSIPSKTVLKYNYIFLEAGVTYNTSTYSVYGNVGVDLLWLLAILGNPSKENEVAETSF